MSYWTARATSTDLGASHRWAERDANAYWRF